MVWVHRNLSPDIRELEAPAVYQKILSKDHSLQNPLAECCIYRMEKMIPEILMNVKTMYIQFMILILIMKVIFTGLQIILVRNASIFIWLEKRSGGMDTHDFLAMTDKEGGWPRPDCRKEIESGADKILLFWKKIKYRLFSQQDKSFSNGVFKRKVLACILCIQRETICLLKQYSQKASNEGGREK